MKRGTLSKRKKEFTQAEIEANKAQCDKHFDADFQKSINENFFDMLSKGYFRAKFVGFEELPERNDPDTPLVFISNHSGMAFPWDAIVFGSQYNKARKYGKRSLRALTAPALSETALMNPYLFENLWKKAGGVDANMLNFESLMQQSEHDVLIFPEGVPGIGKGFAKKYELQRFSGSFVRMAIKYKADIIPYVTVNGEYINPYAYRWKPLNKLGHLLGIPYIPIGLATVGVPLQPWIFYMGFPAQLTYVRLNRIKAYEMTDKPFEELTYEDFREITSKIREEVQLQLNEAEKKYGKKPFNWKTWWQQMKKYRHAQPSLLPMFWHLVLGEFESRLRKEDPLSIKIKLGLGSLITYLFKNPFTFFYFLPILGWIPIMIRNFIRSKRID